MNRIPQPKGRRHSVLVAATSSLLIVGVTQLATNSALGAPAKRTEARTAAAPFLNKAPDTFIADDFCLEVWRSNRMPLKVYFHPCENVAGYDAKFRESFVDACTDLSTASANVITFQFTDKEAEADIDVRWVATKGKEFANVKWSDAIGLCLRTVSPSDGTVEHASLYFLTKPEHDAATKYGQKFMQQTCEHELGHACGLGHSLRNDDVMFKRHSPGTLLPDGTLELASEPHFTSRDSESLKLLVGAQNKIINIQESSNPKTAGTQLNNEAFRLIKSGDNGQALIYLRAALGQDETNKLAMQNAMVAMFNCACDLNNTCHWAEALPILDKSIKLARNVGTAQELNAMLSVQRNCMTQLGAARKTN